MKNTEGSKQLEQQKEHENNEQTLNIIKRKEIQQDALSALQNLGFKSVEAKSAIDKIVAEGHINDASELVKEALRSLAKG